MNTALILGSTGLVGRECLKLLLESEAYARVVAVGRRAPETSHPRLEAKTIDFERLEGSGELFRADDIFYCLGTTLSQAGSREAFRRVDFGYPTRIARLARAGGARKWLMISSIGASPGSPSFYLRVKGEAERDIAALGFAETHFFRPSFLLGKRPVRRPLEEAVMPLARALSFGMRGPLSRFRPVEAGEVAGRMVAAARNGAPGVSVHFFGA